MQEALNIRLLRGLLVKKNLGAESRLINLMGLNPVEPIKGLIGHTPKGRRGPTSENT